LAKDETHRTRLGFEYFGQAGHYLASRPWSDTSEAIVAYEPNAGRMPSGAERLNLKYFLEVFIARNFIEDWTANCDDAADHSTDVCEAD
jgi:hypothetical protein